MSEVPPVKVTSLRELPRDIAPARDLWPEIEGRLRASAGSSAGVRPRRASARAWASLAGLAAALAVGIWIGHGLLPLRTGTPATMPVSAAATDFVTDPRYVRVHSELLRTLDQRLAALPPATRAKVLASLDTIHKSMQDIQAALGRDPGNALLQELLVNTYQDEMRVLTDVQDATPGSGET